jgi:hypothetical protein
MYIEPFIHSFACLGSLYVAQADLKYEVIHAGIVSVHNTKHRVPTTYLYLSTYILEYTRAEWIKTLKSESFQTIIMMEPWVNLRTYRSQ